MPRVLPIVGTSLRIRRGSQQRLRLAADAHDVTRSSTFTETQHTRVFPETVRRLFVRATNRGGGYVERDAC